MTDLNELAVFVAVVDAASFVGAARALGMPTSTVSRRVASLEDRLGARLLHRTTRRVGLTEAGERLHARAASVVREAREAERAVRELGGTPRGLLRVTSVPLFAREFLVPVACEYLQRYPEAEVELLGTLRLVDLIGEGFDLAVRAGPLQDSSLMARRLVPGQAVVCASPDYLARHGTPAHPEDLARHDCILRQRRGGDSSIWRFEGGDAPLEIEVRGRLRVSSPELAYEAVRAGLGVARVPAFVAEPALRSGELEHLLEAWALPPLLLHALWPSSRHLSIKVRAFLDLLSERVTSQSPQES